MAAILLHCQAMKQDWDPHHLDVRAFARAAGALRGTLPLAQMPRLAVDAVSRDGDVRWAMTGSLRKPTGGTEQVWLTLEAEVTIALTCQRCLGPVGESVSVQRSFRFVADEATAEREDESSDEDVLVWGRSMDVLSLIEDELIMGLPMVPMHAHCPMPAGADGPEEGGEPPREHPFAGLAGWRGRKS